MDGGSGRPFPSQREDPEWERDGYFRVDRFLSTDDCRSLAVAANTMLMAGDGATVARFESNLSRSLPMARRVSKLYRFHRSEPFRSLCTGPRLIRLIQPLIPGDIDVFLSQVVWKVPGALGQPWHQDSSIFPFEPSCPVVAAWIALTMATEEDSCLRVVAGSHEGPVAPHARDTLGPTAGRYVALRDQHVVDYQSVTMGPGDLVVFDSGLVHSSGDNRSDRPRVALCFHFASAGTLDRTAERFGASPYNDWMPAFRVAATL